MISWPSRSCRLQVTVYLLRDSCSQKSGIPSLSAPSVRSESPLPGLSILTTSAPNSARIVAQNGAAMNVPRSRTFKWASGFADIDASPARLAEGRLELGVGVETENLVILGQRGEPRHVLDAAEALQLVHRRADSVGRREETARGIDSNGEAHFAQRLGGKIGRAAGLDHIGECGNIERRRDFAQFRFGFRRLDENHVGARLSVGSPPRDRLGKAEGRARIGARDDQCIVMEPALAGGIEPLRHLSDRNDVAAWFVTALLWAGLIFELDRAGAGRFQFADRAAYVEKA